MQLSGNCLKFQHNWCKSLKITKPGTVQVRKRLQSWKIQCSKQSRRNEIVDEKGRIRLKCLTREQLEKWCVAVGEKPSRAMHIWRWLYYDNNWIRELSDTNGQQDGFSRAFQTKAKQQSTLDAGLKLQKIHSSEDGTRKIVFEVLGENQGVIETVLIPVVREKGKKERITVCVSSQIGCAMNCQFCQTGRIGFKGNLTTAQIIEQVVEAKRILSQIPNAPPATNVVFMGEGEPLQNLDAILTAMKIMTDPWGLHFSHNKVCVSTVGLVPEIYKFCQKIQDNPVQLAVSLHATTNEIRDWIVPINRKYNIQMLIQTLEELFQKGGVQGNHGRHVLIEYVMLHNVNDTEQDATRLVNLLQKIECKVNLIQFNKFPGAIFEPSTQNSVEQFRSILIQNGYVCTVRESRGDDEMMACGQLGLAGMEGVPLLPYIKPPEQYLQVLENSLY